MSSDSILLMHSPDHKGILAAVTDLLVGHDGDVRDAQSFGDEDTGRFFVRMHLRLPTAAAVESFRRDIAGMSGEFGVRWELHDNQRTPSVLILVSKFDHCLVDLLHRWRTGSLRMDIPLVASNHEVTRPIVEWHDIPFRHLPVTPESRHRQESTLRGIVEDNGIDLVILARYMQILSPETVEFLTGRCINIHHSFLPSFKGARPYRQAYDRGVKLIGATAHYVTEDLDEGPIIEQDVRRVTHQASAAEMTAVGRETESSVLARAVRWHLEHRVMLNGNKTVVFA